MNRKLYSSSKEIYVDDKKDVSEYSINDANDANVARFARQAILKMCQKTDLICDSAIQNPKRRS